MSDIAYLSLGSNLGDRQKQLRDAIQSLGGLGRLVAVSSIYETQPVEVTDQPWFLNCAVALETSRSPQQLLSGALAIERDMGRERTRQKGARKIDIDVLLYGEQMIHSHSHSPQLIVPHPAMHQRRFVLEPLAEIAPEVRHPVLKKTIKELLAGLHDSAVVRRLGPPGEGETKSD